MSTNIDRAADHMESLDRLYDYGSGHMPSNAERAQALADAGLLAPDLPEPTIWEQGNHPEWGNRPYATGVDRHPCGGLTVFTPYAHWLTPRQARQEAAALLAAANYAEDHS